MRNDPDRTLAEGLSGLLTAQAALHNLATLAIQWWEEIAALNNRLGKLQELNTNLLRRNGRLRLQVERLGGTPKD